METAGKHTYINCFLLVYRIQFIFTWALYPVILLNSLISHLIFLVAFLESTNHVAFKSTGHSVRNRVLFLPFQNVCLLFIHFYFLTYYTG